MNRALAVHRCRAPHTGVRQLSKIDSAVSETCINHDDGTFLTDDDGKFLNIIKHSSSLPKSNVITVGMLHSVQWHQIRHHTQTHGHPFLGPTSFTEKENSIRTFCNRRQYPRWVVRWCGKMCDDMVFTATCGRWPLLLSGFIRLTHFELD